MTTYQLFEQVTNNQTSRANSCYSEIDGVVLRISDHQANFSNFSCYNDIENSKAIINVIITNDFVSDKDFESFLDSNDLQGEQIIVNDFDGIVEYIKDRIQYFK
jgi:hypothetical protein